MPFATIPQLLDELRAGRMVVMLDDEDRENEGDLIMAAEKVRPEDINFMAREARGLICLALTERRCVPTSRFRSKPRTASPPAFPRTTAHTPSGSRWPGTRSRTTSPSPATCFR